MKLESLSTWTINPSRDSFKRILQERVVTSSLKIKARLPESHLDIIIVDVLRLTKKNAVEKQAKIPVRCKDPLT